MKALETGQNIDLISERITAKRQERKDIETQLAIEIQRSVTLSEAEILFFLNALKKEILTTLNTERPL